MLIIRVNACDILSFFDEYADCGELPDIKWTQLSTGPVGQIKNMKKLGLKIEIVKHKYQRHLRYKK